MYLSGDLLQPPDSMDMIRQIPEAYMPTPSLPFHGPERDSRLKVLLQKRVKYNDRQHRDKRDRHPKTDRREIFTAALSVLRQELNVLNHDI